MKVMLRLNPEILEVKFLLVETATGGILQKKVYATLFKKRLLHKRFTVNFEKFLRTPFFQKHLHVTVSNLGLQRERRRSCTRNSNASNQVFSVNI